MVENSSADTSGCRFLVEPKFQSMKDVKRASDNYRDGVNPSDALEKIDSYREFRTCCFETSLKMLQTMNFPENRLVSARLKRMPSIQRKLARCRTFYVNGLDDIVGFRVIFQSLSDLQSAVDALPSVGIKMKNYLEQPQYTGYRGVHAIFRFEQPFNEKTCFTVRFEVQLKTYYQHMWACWCEGMGEQAKEGWPNRRGDPIIQGRIAHLKDISEKIRVWENANPRAIQIQKEFPLVENLSKKIAVVRGDKNGYIGLESCGNTIEAFEILKEYEEEANLEAVLLLGLSEDEIDTHFSKTHINWFNKVPEPEHWLPT